MSHVIAIASPFAGAGKSTTAVNLGASLAAAELRVLVIDLDPRGHAGSGLGIRAAATPGSLYGVLMDFTFFGHALHRGGPLPSLDLVPSTPDLAAAETQLADFDDRQFRLARSLVGFRDLYDFILVDCPPALGLLTLNALVAADTVLVPLPADTSATRPAVFSETLGFVRRDLNPRLDGASVLVRMRVAPPGSTPVGLADPAQHLGAGLLTTTIPDDPLLAEGMAAGRPALLLSAGSAGAQAYLLLASEIRCRPLAGRPVAP